MLQNNKKKSAESKAQTVENKQAVGRVRAKKQLGQHFLTDENVAEKIAGTLSLTGYTHVLEIGPGMGMLTKYLLLKPIALCAMEIDKESAAYLRNRFPTEHPPEPGNNQLRLIEADFLTFDLKRVYGDTPFAIIGNFPYNISSQIIFKTLTLRHQIPEFSGMFQKEVAQRICALPGSKTYGILSVLVQAFYNAAYVFTVPPQVFDPPPKVHSGVLRLTRKERFTLHCDEVLFFKVVKTAFNQRRKTLRNSLKTFNLSHNLKEDAIFGQRPEQLSVADFVMLTQRIAYDSI